MKKGLHVTAARPAQPSLWTAKLDRFKGSKHHTTLITCHRAGPSGPDSRWATPSPGGGGRREQIISGARGKGAARLLPYSHVSRHRTLLQGSCTKQIVIHSATIYPSPGTASVCDLIPGDTNLSWLLSDSPHSHHPAPLNHQMGPFFWTVNISETAQLWLTFTNSHSCSEPGPRPGAW